MDSMAPSGEGGIERELLLELHRHVDAVVARLRATGSPDADFLARLDAETGTLHVKVSVLDAPWAGALGTLLSAIHSARRTQHLPGPLLAARLLAAAERTRKKLPPPGHPGTVSRMSNADNRNRAEFPPAHYWRRWGADAPPPQLPEEEQAEQVAATLAEARPPAPAGAVAAQPAAGASGERYRVLVVEDDPSQALFAETVINGAGMEAMVALVPHEVLGYMESFRPDVVLMDLHMPGIDGVELTGMIRSHPTLGNVPIVFLTGDPDPERRFEVLGVGADDFLTKPVRPRNLVLTLQSRVRRARALQAASPQAGDTAGTHPATGLRTRPQLLQLLASEIPSTRSGALFLVEIEGVSALRDRYGYATVEDILTGAGRHLRSLVGDAPATRLNDNTFLVYVPGMDAAGSEEFARTLRDGLGRQPFQARDQAIRLRATVGHVALAHGFEDAGSALAAAEQALRAARNSPIGIAGWMPAPAEPRQDTPLLDMVREAIEGGGLELAFQPIVAVAGGNEAQYQTLARMRDRQGRLYTAGEFLPAADAAGLLHEVDRRALEMAIDTLAQRHAEGRLVRLFVSQSAQTLARDGYAAHLLTLLSSSGIEGPSLVVDVRQDDAVIHALSLQEFCRAMVPAGVQLCLSQYRPDAEGRALLAQLPLGFVRLAAKYSSSLDDPGVRDEMREAIELAHRHGLLVVGQQVENPQAAATLWMSGVDFIQGNLVQHAAEGLDFDFHHSVL